jgi:hypothetical protein
MNNETQSNKFIVNNPEIQLKAESIANEAEVNYSEMYDGQSDKFIAKEHKDNELDNLYHALYRLSNATNAVISFIKTNNDAIQSSTFAINSRAIELEKSIGLNEPASGQIPATPNVN